MTVGFSFSNTFNALIERFDNHDTSIKTDLENIQKCFSQEVTRLQEIIESQKIIIQKLELENLQIRSMNLTIENVVLKQNIKFKNEAIGKSFMKLGLTLSSRVFANKSIFLKYAEYLLPQEVASAIQTSTLVNQAARESDLLKQHPYAMRRAFSNLKDSLLLLDPQEHRICAWKDVEHRFAFVKGFYIDGPRKKLDIQTKLQNWVGRKGHAYQCYILDETNVNQNDIFKLLSQTAVVSSVHNEQSVALGRPTIFKCQLLITKYLFSVSMGYFPMQPVCLVRRINIKYRAVKASEENTQLLLDLQPRRRPLSQDQANSLKDNLSVIKNILNTNLIITQFLHFLLIAATPSEFEIHSDHQHDFKNYEKALWAGLEEVLWTPFIRALADG